MKILLTAVNAKYIHSNLAVYSLSAYAEAYRDYGRTGCDPRIYDQSGSGGHPRGYLPGETGRALLFLLHLEYQLCGGAGGGVS